MLCFKLCGAKTTAVLWFWEHLWLFISFPPSFDLSNIINRPKNSFLYISSSIWKTRHLTKYALEALLFISNVLYAQHFCLCCQTNVHFLQTSSINMHVIIISELFCGVNIIRNIWLSFNTYSTFCIGISISL